MYKSTPEMEHVVQTANRLHSLKDGVAQIQLNSWEDLYDEIRRDSSLWGGAPFSIWRGQRHIYPLIPKLERASSASDHNKAQRRKRHLRSFRRASLGKLGAITRPKDKDDDQWWALGQHYGLSTPLLDWTHSPFVALFFAFAEPPDPCWQQNPGLRAIYRLFVPVYPDGDKQRPGENEIALVEPWAEDNARLISQQGLFTLTHPPHTIASLLRGFGQAEGSAPESRSVTAFMWEYLIPDKDRDACLRCLNSMNINYATVFPDIDGAARHCNMSLMIEGY